MSLNIEKSIYEEELKIISIEKASRLAIILFGVLVIVLGLPFFFMHREIFLAFFSNFEIIAFIKDCFSFILLFVIGIVLHELIHGLTWLPFIKGNFKNIRFGIMWKYFTPYCHCKVPLKVKHYIIGAMMPAIILDVIPTIIAFFTGSIMFFYLGVNFIVAASGDFLITYMLRSEDGNSYVLDHDSLPGCTVYRLK